jgi:hypothetical protein
MIFTRAHLTQPAHVLRRPLIEQSDAQPLRAVIDACHAPLITWPPTQLRISANTW